MQKYPLYQEFDIDFMPSYKRNRTDNGYFNKKNQAPSYTDRILIRNNTDQVVRPNSYDCLDEVYGSDHRPVILDLTLELAHQRFMAFDRLIDPA